MVTPTGGNRRFRPRCIVITTELITKRLRASRHAYQTLQLHPPRPSPGHAYFTTATHREDRRDQCQNSETCRKKLVGRLQEDRHTFSTKLRIARHVSSPTPPNLYDRNLKSIQPCAEIRPQCNVTSVSHTLSLVPCMQFLPNPSPPQKDGSAY